jgi:hypothetical protein
MSMTRVLAMSVCVAAIGCGGGTGASATATPPVVHGTLNEVMKGILFPNSNIIFDAQDRDPAIPVPTSGEGSPYAGVYGGWEAIHNAGIALAESANLITLAGRVCDNGRQVPLGDEAYLRAAQGLREVGMATTRIAESRQWDQDVMFKLGDDLAVACAACHDVYRDKIVDGKPAGLEARCVQ